MIITFQLVVSLAYVVWKRISDILFESANANQELDHNSNPEHITSIEVDNENGSQNESDKNIDSIHIEPRLNLTLSSLDAKSESYLCSQQDEEQEDEYEIIQATSFDELAGTDAKKLLFDVKSTFECLCDEKGIRFVPPVYIQRYMLTEGILKQPFWANTVKKIVDFGCSELKFENFYLKKLEGIREIIAVDLDEEILSHYSCILMPSIPDFLQRRSTPLKIKIFCGSVAHTNEALVGCDAVVAIELIEHLYPEDLENLPFTVFGFIKPSIAIFTTPNADFNVLFTDLSGFRHDDHKFEWSRQQFEDWGNNLAVRYPEYSVTFQGVGPGPADSEHLGCCSQMATFVRVYGTQSAADFEIHVQDSDYKLINEYIYPYEERTREEIIRDEVLGFINNSILLKKRYDESVVKEIHLKAIMERSKCYSREKLKNILKENNWPVEINKDGYEVVIVPDSDSEDELSSNISEECYEQYQSIDTDCETFNVDIEENWDSNDKESGTCFNNPVDFASSVHCDTQIHNNTCLNSLAYSLSEMCPGLEASVSNLDVNTTNQRSGNFSEHESVTDCSIYKTPSRIEKLTTQLNNKSIQNTSQVENKINDSCIKAPVFGMSASHNECDIDKVIYKSHVENEKPESFCCVSSATMFSDENSKSESLLSHDNLISSFNISPLTTPCCSKLHKNNIPKCLSLQEISSQCSSPIFTDMDSLSRIPEFSSEKRDKISKSMEGFTQDICDAQQTCSNDSKVLDSGYPDSCSGYNMDLDLTPEQFDEIESESEGNDASSRSLSPPVPPVQMLHVVDQVENGDVANNNRDGEGNNMIADIDEEPFEFEAQIEELNNDVPNLAGGNDFHLQEINHCRNESLSPGQRSVDMEVESLEFEAKIEGINIGLGRAGQPVFQESDHCNDRPQLKWPIIPKEPIEFKSQIKDTDKDFSGCTTVKKSSSLIDSQKFDNFSNQSNLPEERCISSTICYVEKAISKPSLPELVLKDHKSSKVLSSESENETSLCDAISDSLHHLDSSKSSLLSSTDGSVNENDISHESLGLIKPSSLTTVIDGCSNIPEFENETCTNKLVLSSLKEHVNLRLNQYSDYESATSLLSESEDTPFPKWLQDIDLTEIEGYDLENRISELSFDGVDSFEALTEVNYYEQIDKRGGGDQDSSH